VWTVSRRIAAPAEDVWRLLVDPEVWPRWGPTVVAAQIDGGFLRHGATGRVWTPVGVPLPFTITDFEPGRRWSWRVAGVPATGHGVEGDGAACRAWMGAPLWAPAYLPVLQIALKRIEEMAVQSGAGGQ